MTVEEVSSALGDKKLSGQLRVSVKFIELQAGGEKGSGAGLTTTRIPAHAILSTLEELLREESLLTDASGGTALPGQIAMARGDVTFESWELLATLADSVQGVATLAAKIYTARQGEVEPAQLRLQLQQLEKLVKKYGPRSEYDEPSRQLATAEAKLHTGYEIVDAGYINDVKDMVKLFFQDQNHVRVATGEITFVGLLRRDCLVGSTMEELLFTYGSKPKLDFTALFYVAELGREEELRLEELGSRFQSLAEQPFSLGVLQEAIRQIGSALLEVAEELRRPIGANATFIVPLAIYRDIEGADDVT